MAGRFKEDEKNEKIIRGLCKQPANRKCINCNSMGPQYVCTTFSTFVCTTCSGIHREFTHRIKSISMAKFTPQEVSSLQAGGNERAKEIYFKELDMHRAPDNNNVDRLRDFIKCVYVDRRYTGERSIDRPPRFKMGDKEELNESRRSDGYRSGSRSPAYDDGYERRLSDRPSPGRDQNSQPHSDLGRSPVHAGVVNDWRREDRFTNGRRSEDRVSSDGNSRIEGISPDRQKNLTISSPPAVRPVRDILGENVTPLRVGEPPKASSASVGDGSARSQRTASFNSLVSNNGNRTELTRENSLIDFGTESTPPVPAAGVLTQTSPADLSAIKSTVASNENNWACFDNASDTKISQAPSNPNSLESVLIELSVPAPAAAPANAIGGSTTGGTPTNASSSGFSIDSLFGSLGPVSISSSNVAPASAPPSNASFFPSAGASAPAAASNTSFFPPAGAPAPDPAPASRTSLFPPAGASAPAASSNTSFFPPAGAPAPAAAPASNTSFFLSTGNAALDPASNGSLSTSAALGMAPTFPVTVANGQWSSVQQQQQQQQSFPDASSQKVTSSFGGVSTSQGPSSNPAAHASQAIASPAQTSYGMGGQHADAQFGGRRELPADLFTATYSHVRAPTYGWQPGLVPGVGLQMQYNSALSLPSFQQSAKPANPFDTGNEASPIQAATFPSMAPLQAALTNMAVPTSIVHTAAPSGMPQSLPHSGLVPPMASSFSSAVPPGVHMVPSNMTPSWHQGYGGYGNGATFGSLNPDQDLNGKFAAPSLPRTASGNPFG